MEKWNSRNCPKHTNEQARSSTDSILSTVMKKGCKPLMNIWLNIFQAESDHRPNFTLQVASEILFASDVEFAAALSINQNLAYLADVTGACERIIRQPAPIEYTR